MLSEAEIVPAESTDITDRTMSTAAHTSPSLSGVQQAMDQTSRKRSSDANKEKIQSITQSEKRTR